MIYNDIDLLEEAYSNVGELEKLDFLLDENAFTDNMSLMIDTMKEIPNTISSIPEFLKDGMAQLGNASKVGLGAGAAAQLLGWTFVGVSKLLDKDVEHVQELKQKIKNDLIDDETSEIDRSDMDVEEIVEFYNKVEKDIAKKLDEEMPLKGKTRWALVLKKIGDWFKGKYGTAAMGLVGAAMYFYFFGTMPVLGGVAV